VGHVGVLTGVLTGIQNGVVCENYYRTSRTSASHGEQGGSTTLELLEGMLNIDLSFWWNRFLHTVLDIPWISSLFFCYGVPGFSLGVVWLVYSMAGMLFFFHPNLLATFRNEIQPG